MNFPSLHKENFSVDGISAIVGSKELDIATTLRYYKVDPDSPETQQVLKQVGLDGVKTVRFGETADRFKAALLILAPDIIEASKREQEAVLPYLKKIGLMSESCPVLCDIGWNGSMQQAISNITGKTLKGLYLGLYNTEKSQRMNDSAYGFFDARLGDALELKYEKLFQDGGILIVESLFTNPEQASLVGIKKTPSGDFEGIEGAWDNDEYERDKVRLIHAAALEFIKDFKSMDLPKSLAYISRNVAIEPLQWIVRNPNDVVAHMFGKVKYSDVASSVPVYIGHPAHDKHFYKKNPDTLREEYERAFWKEGFRKNCEVLGIPL